MPGNRSARTRPETCLHYLKVELMENTVALYESVAVLTAQMLHAAQQKNWGRLKSLEARSVAFIVRIQELSAHETLDEHLKRRKLGLIKHILADDKAIRELTSPWMARLDRIMHPDASSPDAVDTNTAHPNAANPNARPPLNPSPGFSP